MINSLGCDLLKYCPKCKKLFSEKGDTCLCGIRLTDKLKNDTPVLLITSTNIEKDRISAILDDEKLPYSIQIKDDKSNVTSVPGFDTASYNFYVPYGFYKKSLDLVAAVSSVHLPDYYDKLPVIEDQEWTEMSPAKRNTVRLLSALAFAAVVWLAVTGVDVIAAFIKNFF